MWRIISLVLFYVALCPIIVAEVISLSVKEVLSVKDAAELLEISPYTIRKHARQGSIPGRKVGREWRFSRDSLLQWLSCGLSRDDLAAVRRGIEDISAGRVLSWEALREELGRE